MITLTIEDSKLQECFESHLNSILEVSNYNNPVKQALDSLLGYNGSMKGEMGRQIEAFLATAMDSPEFQAQLGKAIAAEMAKKAVQSMKEKK